MGKGADDDDGNGWAAAADASGEFEPVQLGKHDVEDVGVVFAVELLNGSGCAVDRLDLQPRTLHGQPVQEPQVGIVVDEKNPAYPSVTHETASAREGTT